MMAKSSYKVDMDKKAPQSTKIEDAILPTEITIESRGYNFVFRMPSIRDEQAIEALMTEILYSIAQSFIPRFAIGPHGNALLRTEATVRTLLKAGPEWVYSKGDNGLPVIDPSKWNQKQINILLEVVDKFYEEKERFQ